jgi:hypothetical protein
MNYNIIPSYMWLGKGRGKKERGKLPRGRGFF